jgi:Flp pilus assembly protein TadG
MAIEAALFIPILVLLLVGMVQIGKITYVYHTLKKMVYTAARMVSVQQGVNFCDLANDAGVQASFRIALSDAAGTPIISDFTPDMLQITTACVPVGDPTAAPGPCDIGGCPAISQRPDYVMVSVPNGYLVRPRIPFLSLDAIPLRPSVTLPFGGVS